MTLKYDMISSVGIQSNGPIKQFLFNEVGEAFKLDFLC